jgi:hypothetical protein
MVYSTKKSLRQKKEDNQSKKFQVEVLDGNSNQSEEN